MSDQRVVTIPAEPPGDGAAHLVPPAPGTAPVRHEPPPVHGMPDEHGLTGEVKGQARIVLGRFFHQPMAVGGLVVIFLMLVASVVVGHFWKWNFSQITPQYNSGPDLAHPFGTDTIGHDMLSQVMRGVEKDIQIAGLVAVFSTAFGVVIGAIAGFFGKWIDTLLMRFVDLVLTVPILAVLIVLANLVASKASNWFWLAIIIASLSWTYVSRLIRAEFLSLRERDFVEASRALGASNSRIIVRHLLPNAIGPIIINATITIAGAIVLESTLSFLGLGITPGTDVSLGLLIANGQDDATTLWWLFLFPAIFLVVLIVSLFLIGDGMREAFDPKKTRVRA